MNSRNSASKIALICAADAGYFDLLTGLIDSVRALPDAPAMDLCVLDLGLSAEQSAHLKSKVTRIVIPEWDVKFPGQDQMPPWFRAMTARPHLPRHFPGYDILVWIDADAWFCNSDALHLALRAARGGQLAIVPEMDRAYDVCFDRRPGVREFMRECYTNGFGVEAADRYATLPAINSGFFALCTDAAHWKTWADILDEALQIGGHPLSEQCALNVGIYTGKIPVHFLPSWCNWKCAEAMPLLDQKTRELFCPMLPHERISVCHLVAIKGTAVKVPCRDGVYREMPLTYHVVRELKK